VGVSIRRRAKLQTVFFVDGFSKAANGPETHRDGARRCRNKTAELPDS
jgi:hypothetical protein